MNLIVKRELERFFDNSKREYSKYERGNIERDAEFISKSDITKFGSINTISWNTYSGCHFIFEDMTIIIRKLSTIFGTYKEYSPHDGNDYTGIVDISYNPTTKLLPMVVVKTSDDRIKFIELANSSIYTFRPDDAPIINGLKLLRVDVRCNIEPGRPDEIMDYVSTNHGIDELYNYKMPDKFDKISELLEASRDQLEWFGYLGGYQFSTILVDTGILRANGRDTITIIFDFDTGNILRSIYMPELDWIVYPEDELDKLITRFRDYREVTANIINILLSLGLYTKSDLFAHLL